MTAIDTHGQRQRIDPIAEPRRHLTPARPRRDAIPVIHVDRAGVGPAEAARRYVDQQAEQARELASDGYTQAAQLDAARDREGRLAKLIADAQRDTGGVPAAMARQLIAWGVRL